MQIPSIFFGKYRQAKLQCRKAAKKIVQGGSFDEVISGSMLDTVNTPGLLVLARCDSTLDSFGENFYCYLLLDEIRGLISSLEIEQSRKIEERCFQESLHSPWGTLGLIAEGNQLWSSAPYTEYISEEGEPAFGSDRSCLDDWVSQQAYPLLKACLQCWDLFCAVGKRYVNTLPYPQELWNLLNNLYRTLFFLGVPQIAIAYPKEEQIFITKMYRPLTSERLQELIALTEQERLI